MLMVNEECRLLTQLDSGYQGPVLNHSFLTRALKGNLLECSEDTEVLAEWHCRTVFCSEEALLI